MKWTRGGKKRAITTIDEERKKKRKRYWRDKFAIFEFSPKISGCEITEKCYARAHQQPVKGLEWGRSVKVKCGKTNDKAERKNPSVFYSQYHIVVCHLHGPFISATL